VIVVLATASHALRLPFFYTLTTTENFYPFVALEDPPLQCETVATHLMRENTTKGIKNTITIKKYGKNKIQQVIW